MTFVLFALVHPRNYFSRVATVALRTDQSKLRLMRRVAGLPKHKGQPIGLFGAAGAGG